jgi:hypothetical protein
MKKLLALIPLVLLFQTAPAVRADAPTTARLFITAKGAPMRFATLGLGVDTTGFTLQAGQTRLFRRLQPGTYVVVQVPPFTPRLQVRCSDGKSNIEYNLKAGDNLTCVYDAT